jgi:hypothetical protein
MDVTPVTVLQLLVLRDTLFSKNVIITACYCTVLCTRHVNLPLKNPSAVGGPHSGCNKNYICITYLDCPASSIRFTSCVATRCDANQLCHFH